MGGAAAKQSGASRNTLSVNPTPIRGNFRMEGANRNLAGDGAATRSLVPLDSGFFGDFIEQQPDRTGRQCRRQGWLVAARAKRLRAF